VVVTTLRDAEGRRREAPAGGDVGDGRIACSLLERVYAAVAPRNSSRGARTRRPPAGSGVRNLRAGCIAREPARERRQRCSRPAPRALVGVGAVSSERESQRGRLARRPARTLPTPRPGVGPVAAAMASGEREPGARRRPDPEIGVGAEEVAVHAVPRARARPRATPSVAASPSVKYWARRATREAVRASSSTRRLAATTSSAYREGARASPPRGRPESASGASRAPTRAGVTKSLVRVERVLAAERARIFA